MLNRNAIPLSDEKVFQVVRGLWKGKKGPFVRRRVIRAKNFRPNGLLDYADIVELDVEEKQATSRDMLTGDIVVERSGGGPKQPVGRVGIFNDNDGSRTDYCTSNFTSVLRVLDREKFVPDFVALYLHNLYLSGKTETLQRATTGIRNLDWSEYLKIAVPIMSKGHQTFVTSVLNHVRRAQDLEQAQLKVVSELKEKTMQELFTYGLSGETQKETEVGPIPESWQIHPIGTYTSVVQYGLSVRGQPEGPIPILRMNCQDNGKVVFRDLQYADVDLDTFEKFRLSPGDILFNRTNSYELVGRTAIFESDNDAVFASYLIRLRVDEDFLRPKYLNYFLNWSHAQSELKKLASRAVGQANINATKLKGFCVPHPRSTREQDEIVEILSAIDEKIDLHKRKKTVLEDLFKSLLHKLMTGEIQVSDFDLSTLEDNPEAVA